MDDVPRVLGRTRAHELGFSRRAIEHRLANGSWRLVLPRTLFTADTLTERDRYGAALVYAGTDAALSGAAALRAAAVDRVRRPDHVLVLVPRTNRTGSHDWVTVRRSDRPLELDRWPGPRHVATARAAADHALGLTRIDDVRSVLAAVVRDGRASIDDLAAELVAAPRRGSRLLREALAEIGGGAASAPEAGAARVLRRTPGIPPFEQNATIRLPGGRTYVADFLWRSLRAILEIDSVEWHLSPAQWRSTMDRHLALTTLGYSLVHRPPSALREAAAFGADIAQWLAGRSGELAG